MSNAAVLTHEVTLRVAQRIKVDHRDGDDSDGDTIGALGVALGLDKEKCEKAPRRSREARNKPVEVIHDLLKEWVDDHGNDAGAAGRLREILASNGHAQAANVLSEKAVATKKKPASKGCGHSHDPRQNDTTKDKIITVVTTIVVALIAIVYAHYKNFKV